MKLWIQQVGVVVMLVVTGVQFSQAQSQTAFPVRAAHRLLDNVRYIKHDAQIYQFERVDDQVDRIVAAGRSLHKALDANPARHAELAALDREITALRSAQWDRNVNGLEAAAEKLSALTTDLLKSAK